MVQPAQFTCHFENRLGVNAFIRQRMTEYGISPNVLSHYLSLKSSNSVTQLFRGRQLISKSKYFPILCELLHITPAESAAIQWAEQGRKS